MQKFIKHLIAYVLLPSIAFSQTPVVINFATPTYTEPLSDSGKKIVEINRHYQKDGTIDPIKVLVNVNFNSAKFNSKCDFRKVHFKSKCDFGYSIFDSMCDFTTAVFDSGSSFGEAKFNMSSNFVNTKFNSQASFVMSNFHRKSDFSKARFRSIAFFTATQFDSEANFSNARFYSKGLFFGANFYSTVSFRYTKFDSTCDFSWSVFDQKVDFNHSHFKRNLLLQHLSLTNSTSFDFLHTVLPDTIDFSHNPFINLESQIIDFTLADSLDYFRLNKQKLNYWQNFRQLLRHYFNPFDTSGNRKKIKINLYNTDVSKIRIDYDHFQPYARDEEFVLFASKEKKIISKEIIESVYQGLIKNFKERGQMDSYEKIDIEYKRFKNDIGPNSFSLQDWWWRYGYEKERVFIHSILFIVLFSIINFFILDNLNNKYNGIYHVDNIPEFSSFKYGKINFLWILRRLRFSLIYTSTIFFLLTLKTDRIRFSNWLSIWVVFIYTIGLICMGFMANLVLQK